MAGYHDVGGSRAYEEAIDREQHAFAPWELRVDALMWLLSDASRTGGPRMTVDQLRLRIEEMPAEDYRSLGYYAKWLRSMIANMDRSGLVDAAAVRARAAELAHLHELEHAREHGHDEPAV